MKQFKTILSVIVLTLCLSSVAFAGDPKTEVKDTKAAPEAKATVSETTVTGRKISGTAIYQYISGDVNDPDSYGMTQVDPDEVCPTPGSNRCAATFNVDSHGNRTGDPTNPVYTKP